MNQKKKNLHYDLNELVQPFYLNLAKNCLTRLTDKEPSPEQILVFQDLMSRTCIRPLMLIKGCLTEKESITLRLSAQGNSIKHIARIFNISTRQVERYRSSILKKLDCKNTPEAVMKGIRFGEINPFWKLEENVKK